MVVMAKPNLGDYVLLKQIGQGTLGTVFLAEHRFMKRHYVLKVLPEELALNRHFIQRFEEGVASLAALEHPHIVKVHNVSHAEGRYFLVTDCVVDSIGETSNLAQHLAHREMPLQEEELWNILHQVAQALDYAHGKNPAIVHGTLKLNNLLIRGEQKDPQIVLSDFGLARLVGLGAILSRTYQVLVEALGFTQEGQEGFARFADDSSKNSRLQASFLQSYSFLAPEQKVVNMHPSLEQGVDAYAFGVLAYFLMTREYPEGVFEMPSKTNARYQRNWDQLIWHCLQKDPKRRPQSLVQAMEQYLGERGTMAFSHSSSARPPISTLPSQQPQPAQAPLPPLQRQEERVAQKVPLSEVPLWDVPPLAKKPPIQEPQAKPQHEPSIQEAHPRLQPEPSVHAYHPGEVRDQPKPVVEPKEVPRPRYDPDPSSALQVDTHVTQYHHQPVEAKNVEPLLSEMVVIQAATYLHGSSEGNRDEMPHHRIHLNSYAIDIHPVTNEQFVRFLDYMGGEKDANNHDIIRLKESRIKRVGGGLNIESGYTKHPVVGVTWYGAVAYAKWVGKRLPTEAEWEVACRGGLDGVCYPTGEKIEKSQANFFSTDTTAVMSYAPNGYGLYDMVGNVYEWVQDWYGYNYYEESAQEPDNPKGPKQGVYRVLRGGCWKSLKEDLRCSHRHRNNPGNFNSTYGFRCATDAE